MSALDGKRVLVLGASSGIGVATAERFAERGASLALVARGDGLAVAGERARERGAAAHRIHADVTDRDALADAIEEAQTWLGGIDVAVLGVGAAAWGPFDKVPRVEFDRVVDVTFRSTVDATRLLLPALERSAGVLVIVGSVAGQLPVPGMSSYVAAKYAVRGFAGSLRMDLRARGSKVRVALVSPGPVDTPFWEHAASPAGESAPPPRFAPYSAETVATAIVDVAESPRRELTVGGLMLAARAAHAVAGGIVEGAFALIGRRLFDADDSPRETATLGHATGSGERSSGLHGRPSLVVNLRRAPTAIVRAIGGRAR